MTGPGPARLLADPAQRAGLGARIERTVEEVFNVLRWSAMVGFAGYMARVFPGPAFTALYWGLAGLLFAYLASRFLLRPEIRLFPRDAPGWQRAVQTAVNILACVVAFVVVLLAVNGLVDAVMTLRLDESGR